MKTRYNNYDELASDWARGSFDHDKGMSTYGDRMKVYPHEPDNIYSYGSHFCIARKFKAADTGRDFVLFTEREYSPTTSTHKQAVKSSGIFTSSQVVFLPTLDRPSYYSGNQADLKIPVTEQDLADQVLANAVAKLEAFGAACLAKRPHKTHPEKFLAVLAQAHNYLQPFPQVSLPDYTDTFEAIKAHCRVQVAKARLIATA